MKHLILLALFLVSVGYCHSQAVDNYAKNSAKLKELKALYEDELENDPNSAIPHLNHADRLAQVSFNARNDAPQYYVKALEVDSTNATIFLHFGTFLLSIGDLTNAYFCFRKGQEYDSENREFEEKISLVEELYNLQNEYWELHVLPELNNEEIEKDLNFKERTNYEKLNKKTSRGKYAYEKLLPKFQSNPMELSAKEMFYLLIGKTQQETYNPYNYDDENKMQELTKNDVLSAIIFGEEIIKDEPLNLLILRELLYCYRKMDQPESVEITENKIDRFFAGILYSGNGSCEEPYIALSVQEEYPFAIYLGYDPIKVINSTTVCSEQMTDKMLVKGIDGVEEFIYFNYTPIFRSIQEKKESE